jgi:hypothetical protein
VHLGECDYAGPHAGRARHEAGARVTRLPGGAAAPGKVASLPVTDLVHTGNAREDGKDNRGWILGHFMPAGDLRHSSDVEIKWAVHRRGEGREEWVTEERRTTAIMLISGRFRTDLPGRSVVLARQGDYVVFHGVSHSWEAETDCVVVGVRWPSVPGYESPGGRIP